ncbi:MAG: hydroxymethylbilane synthase [Rhabdochlamydiaceae bacterium]|nr:hydroxymethylbilane synthase [Rhabdochlamydiaceae bacterium]
MRSSAKEIVVGARSSPLSQVQVDEVYALLQNYYPEVTFVKKWFQTQGDLDQSTSLVSMEKTDFFTKEVDQAVLQGVCRIGIHSAKDLPEPMPLGLTVVACTQGVDPSDVLVLRDGETWENLPLGAKIGTSSLRRERNIYALRSDFICMDIRGTIEKRLSLLDAGTCDGLVIAKAALLRLRLERNMFPLEGEISPMQGRLAIVAKTSDVEMQELFLCLHKR